MKFNLAGATLEVIETDNIEHLGHTDPDKCVICIKANQTQQSKELTMTHEIVHAIMFTMGERDHDERFVEGFAQLLYQYEKQL